MNASITKEGVLLCYADTNDKTFPLILVVGREAAFDGELEYRVDNQIFELRKRGGGFWNTSYAIVARINEMLPYEFKHLCYKRQCSPIVFADSSPKPIANAANSEQKLSRRLASTSYEIEQHISKIFDLEMINRVQLIFLAVGVGSKLFKPAIDKFKQHADQSGIPTIETPFMIGYNTPEIKQKLAQNPKIYQTIKEIVAQFTK